MYAVADEPIQYRATQENKHTYNLITKQEPLRNCAS